MKVFGSRIAVEAMLLVAVPVVMLLAGQGPWVIVAAAGIAYLGVFAAEAFLGRRPPQPQPAPVRTLHPVPDPEPDSEPGPEPELPPAAEAPPESEPGPEPPPVVPIGVGSAPRQWNLRDLEKLSRKHAGSDEARDEERSFLLMYLRDFAGPDGVLPADFDGLVRDSFGELVGAR